LPTLSVHVIQKLAGLAATSGGALNVMPITP